MPDIVRALSLFGSVNFWRGNNLMADVSRNHQQRAGWRCYVLPHQPSSITAVNVDDI